MFYRTLRQRLMPFGGVLSFLDYQRTLRTPRMVHGSCRVLGSPVRYSDSKGFLHSVREIFCDEVYRFRAGRNDPLIVDAGANIGLSTLYFKTLYENSRIIAYEPDPAIFRLLEQNVAEAKLTQVELRNSAAWVEDTTLMFFPEGSLAGSTEVDFLHQSSPVKVNAERLRSILERGPIDFLKMDIEGGECAVLHDIAPMLRNVAHLFFEYHSIPGRKQTLGDLLCLVTSAGFRYSLNRAQGERLPFVTAATGAFDLQVNVSCFRT